jgi:hypothetical protein
MRLSLCIFLLKEEQHTQIGLSIQVVRIDSQHRGKLLRRKLRLFLTQKLMRSLLMNPHLLRGGSASRLRLTQTSSSHNKQHKK